MILWNTQTKMNTKSLVLSVLLILCSACGKADMSDARMNHLMAADHGWIDLTLKSLAPSKVKANANANDCTVAFSVNGETLLRESANFAAAQSKGNPIGYRFPAPSGDLDIELNYSICVKDPVVVKQTLNLPKDHLMNIVFDGSKLSVERVNEYIPPSLEWVRAELESMRGDASDTEHRISYLSKLVLCCIGFNLVVVVLLLWRRRSA